MVQISMKIFDKAVSNTIYLFSDWMFVTFMSFLFWLVGGKLLTQEQYGMALTSINLVVFLSGLVCLGIPPTITKLVPEYLRKKDYKKMKALISISIIVTILINSVLALFTLLNIEFLSSFLKIPELALKLSIINLFVASLTTIFAAVVYGSQNMKRYFIAHVGFGIVKVGFATALLFLGYGFFALIIGVILGNMISTLILITPQYFTLNFSSFEKSKLIKYAIPGLIGTITYGLLSNSQYIIVSIIKTSATTGIFGIAMIISSVVVVIPTILNSSIFPIMSELSVEKNRVKSQRKLIDYVLRYSLFLSIPLIFIFSLFPDQFILIFSSARFLGASKLLPLLTIASLLFGLSTIFNTTIYAIRKPKIYRNILIMVSIIFILLASILTYLLADIGMTIGYFATMTIYFLLSFFALKKYLKIRFPIKDLFKIIISCLLSFSFLHFVRPYVHNIILAGILILAGFLIYGIILLKMKFYKPEDIRILKTISKKFKFLKSPIDIISNIIESY